MIVSVLHWFPGTWFQPAVSVALWYRSVPFLLVILLQFCGFVGFTYGPASVTALVRICFCFIGTNLPTVSLLHWYFSATFGSILLLLHYCIGTNLLLFQLGLFVVLFRGFIQDIYRLG